MKKLTSLLLVVAMSFVLIFSGCGGDSSGADTAKPVEDDGETVYTFKVNTHVPETIPPGMITTEACEYATEKSGGRLQFEIYYSGNYVAYEDTFLGVSDKVVDIAMIDASSIAQSYVLNQIFSKPIKTDLPPQDIMEQIYHTFLAENKDQLNAEFTADNVTWLSAGALAGYNLHIKEKAVTTPDDLKGVKLETLGDAVSYFAAMGASAVAMDPGDNYSALEKNLIDGQATHWAIMGDFATKDFLKNHTIFGKSDIATLRTGGLYAPLNGFVMNLDSWNSIPAEFQAILIEAFNYGEDRMYEYDKETVAATWQGCIDRGDSFTYVTGDDLQPWYDAMDVTNGEWFEACAEAGYDNAEDLYNKLIETIKSMA